MRRIILSFVDIFVGCYFYHFFYNICRSISHAAEYSEIDIRGETVIMLDWQIPINKIHEKHCLNIEQCDPNAILYHYTSPAGLLGILNSSTLWMSDSDFLNDSSESDYFYDVYHKATPSEGETRKEDFFRFTAGMFSYYHSSMFSSPRQTAGRVKETRYILSMSLDRDNLNLWSYYTKNANSVGYSIGIKEDLFKYLRREDEDESLLSGKVIYDSEKQMRLLGELYQDYWEQYATLKHTYQREYLYRKMEDNIVRYSVFMKNPLFAHENEYRVAVVRLGSNSTQQRLFREMNGAFIPYITQSIDLRDIVEIGISPTHRTEFVTRSLRELLEAKGIDANPYNSEVPLRY